MNNKTISKLILKHENYLDGALYRFELYRAPSFSHLSGVRQVYGVILNSDNKILLVSGSRKRWILPGGGVEEGEMLRNTLIREAYEEAAVVVDEKSIQPFFFQKVYSLADNKEKYLSTEVRYICRIKKQDEFIKDPDEGDIKYQISVDVKELDKYLKWGETTGFIQRELLRKIAKEAQSKLQFHE